MKKALFSLFRAVERQLGGRGLGDWPLVGAWYRALFRAVRPRGIVEVVTRSIRLRINAADPGIAPWLLMGKEFSPGEVRLLERTLKPGMIFVDVGANIGYFTLIAAKLVGFTGKVYAFEPDEDNFNLLYQNIKLNNFSQVVAIKRGVSDRNGQAKLYRDPNNPCRHSLAPNETAQVIEIATVTLDEFFADQPRFDMIKIDVEGAEPAVFAGMKKLIAANPKLILLTEFYPAAIRRFGASPEKYLVDLQTMGFSLNRLAEGGSLRPISSDQFSVLARGDGMKKLINLVGLMDIVT